MRIFIQLLLFIIEYGLKLAAPLAVSISLGARYGFLNKIMYSFRSLPDAIRKIGWWIGNIPAVSEIVDDYQTLTASSFNQKYGAGAVNYVMDYLGESISYFQKVYNNLSEQPIATIMAALIVLFIFLAVAWIARFVRQKGQGSLITKFERRMGKRVFGRSD